MEKVGYVMFDIGAVGLGLLLAYGIYINAGIIPALATICVELIITGIILAISD